MTAPSQTLHGDFSVFSNEAKHQPVSTPSQSSQPAQAITNRTVTPHPVVRSAFQVGRNDPCPCGSGKKFKKCHGLV